MQRYMTGVVCCVKVELRVREERGQHVTCLALILRAAQLKIGEAVEDSAPLLVPSRDKALINPQQAAQLDKVAAFSGVMPS